MKEIFLIAATSLFLLGCQSNDNDIEDSSQSSETISQVESQPATYEEGETTHQIEEPSLRDQLNVSTDDPELVLVGPDYPISQEEIDQIPMIVTENGYIMAEIIQPSYQAWMGEASQLGYQFSLVSAYRSIAHQAELFENSLQSNLAEFSDEDLALAETKRFLTEPGHSEHHTGLALDIADAAFMSYHGNLWQEMDQLESQQWLIETAPKHGFILRYPAGKEAITKIGYEPWHFRYVGPEVAQYMTENNLTLEEFLEEL